MKDRDIQTDFNKKIHVISYFLLKFNLYLNIIITINLLIIANHNFNLSLNQW